MAKTFYLPTRADGSHFFADGIAAPGQTLVAVSPPAPWPARAIRVSETPGGAWNAGTTDGRARLFAVSADDADAVAPPTRKGRGGLKSRLARRASTVHAFSRVEVLEELDVALMFGPDGVAYAELMRRVSGVRACDLNPDAETLADKWLATQGDDADDEKTPTSQAMWRAHELLEKHLPELSMNAGMRVKEESERAVTGLFDIDLNRRYDAVQRRIGEAAYLAGMAVTIRSHLAPEDFATLTADLRAFTGIDARDLP